jgi:hypothetical protein
LDERFTARAFKTTAQCSIARKGLQRGAAIRRANALGAEPEAGRAYLVALQVDPADADALLWVYRPVKRSSPDASGR